MHVIIRSQTQSTRDEDEEEDIIPPKSASQVAVQEAQAIGSVKSKRSLFWGRFMSIDSAEMWGDVRES